MTLSVAFHAADRDVDVAFEVPDGETVALLGPNGAGKSTVLQVLAGFLRPRTVSIRLADRVLAESGRGVWLPAEQRRIGLLAQDALLFPHLDVTENVAFGPRSAGLGRARARKVAHDWLAEVEASELASRPSRALSGGQAQRVALARTLAATPDVVLLDEPMAALDAETVPLVRRVLRRTTADRTALLVTHDPIDALALADRALVLERGRIIDDGTPEEVLAHPRSAFVARLAGLNLVVGRLGRDGLTANGLGLVPGIRGDLAGDVFASFPPSAVTLDSGDGIPVLVEGMEPLAGRALVSLVAADAGGDPAVAPARLLAEVPIADARRLTDAAGSLVRARIRPEDVAVYAR